MAVSKIRTKTSPPNFAFRTARPLQSPTPSQPPLLVAPTTSHHRRRSPPPSLTPPLQLRRASPSSGGRSVRDPLRRFRSRWLDCLRFSRRLRSSAELRQGRLPRPLEEPWVRDRRSGTTIATAWTASGFFSAVLG